MKNKLVSKIEEFNERQKKLFDTSIFLSKMLLAGAFFQLLIIIYPDTTGFQAALADITQRILEILGVNLRKQGINLIDQNVTYIVTQDCLGWKSMAAFTALIFSSTNQYRKYIKPLVLGLLAIINVNIFRIVTTIYLSHINLISFEIIHSFFWKWGLTFLVIIMWIIWFHWKSGK